MDVISIQRNQYAIRTDTDKFMFCRTGETGKTRKSAVWELYDQTQGYTTVCVVKVHSDLGSKLEAEQALTKAKQWIYDNH